MTLNDISGDIISGLVVETVSKLFQNFWIGLVGN